MNSTAARIIKAFCQATGEAPRDIKRQYTRCPALKKRQALDYFIRVTKAIKEHKAIACTQVGPHNLPATPEDSPE